MATLHIQHPVTDFDTWRSAFNRFAEARCKAGVRAQRVQRPVDNPRFVVIDLDFDSAGEAQSFKRFLTTHVWANPENSPGLAGAPETMVLEPAAILETAVRDVPGFSVPSAARARSAETILPFWSTKPPMRPG